MEQRKYQFLGFVVILLSIGFLNYFRKLITLKIKLGKKGKILYLATMVVFIVGIMFVLYFTNINNIVSFCLGLMVAALSEHIAKLFLVVGDNFNPIVVKIIKRYFNIDLTKEIEDFDGTSKFTNKENTNK